MERIGIYGGTFNPPHMGHLRAASCALKVLQLQKLLLIPTREAPHKQIPTGSPSPQQRLEMLKLAAAGMERTEISDLELNREGPSFTYETVEALRADYPEVELVLLMGTDMFTSFLNWKELERILKQVSLGVFCRGSKGEAKAIAEQKQKLEALGATVYLVENPVVDISSTQLRRMLVFQCAVPFLPAGVGDYIQENRLYGTDRDYRNLPMEELEQVVVSLLNPNRVAHVLGCRDTAAELAVRWGVDVTDAARAGLLHDITKVLDGPLQLTLCDEYGSILNDFSRRYPKTLHALTGSLVAQRIFGENERVVSAICSHTTGKGGMNTLEKIIYVADYMEPCRNFPGVERLRALAFSDLDAALKCGLEMTLEHLKNQGSEVSPETQEALAWLNR